MAKLLTPRGYLSWTQIDMWRRSRERYVQKYMLSNGGEITSAAMEFGKVVSTALEDGKDGGDGAIGTLLSLLPAYKEREHEIRAKLKAPSGEVELLGKLDTFDPKTLMFREYKTGVTVWTKGAAQKHRQMHHYATLIYLKHGKLSPGAFLDWAQTERSGGDVRLTGRIHSFPVILGLSEVLEYMAYAGKVAAEIDEEYRAQLKKIS